MISVPPMRSFVNLLAGFSLLAGSLLLNPSNAHAYSYSNRDAHPPGAPGIAARWNPSLKEAVGTSASRQSNLWFTVAEGIVTEVFYPTVDRAQVGDLQFVVTDGRGFFSEQRRDTHYRVHYATDGMAVEIRGEDKSGKYSFRQTLVSDDASPVLRIKTHFDFHAPGLKVFVLYRPAMNGSGNQNQAEALKDALVARSGPYTSVLRTSAPMSDRSAGYVGFSDGWQTLRQDYYLSRSWRAAGPGNVALTAELQTGGEASFEYDLALAFGRSYDHVRLLADSALQKPFSRVRENYEAGWNAYVRRLEQHLARTESPSLLRTEVARRSVILIKMHEDKLQPGAIVASLSKPAAPGGLSADDSVGGYSLVWPRDLYHSAMGLLAAGDVVTPRAILDYLVLRQNADGSWGQNFYVDGTPYWTAIQMDQVAFPVLLAERLSRHYGLKLTRNHLTLIARATGYLISRGPYSPQDRWEEIGGYIPSTLAAQIAALRAGARILGPGPYAQDLLRVADQWQSQIERWTLVPESYIGKNYYQRVSLKGDASIPENYDIANGGGRATSWEILDGGFLELVRLGVRSADDPRILSTLKLYDQPKVGLASHLGAASYRRYNRDAYGPNQVGGYWPLLAGERGVYAVAAGDLPRARAQLRVMEHSALPSGHIPEQTMTAGNAHTPSQSALNIACPLAWSHAEYLVLKRSIDERKPFDTP